MEGGREGGRAYGRRDSCAEFWCSLCGLGFGFRVSGLGFTVWPSP